ncbi:hypothetical protein Tco_0016018 [Tanacetum coccineum]
MKIHHNVEFFKLPQRRYKFVELDYVDLVDSDIFSLYELCGMLEELGLGDNNKILFIHFRILGMSFDDGLVPLITDDDVIELLNYVTGCKEKEVYIETGNGVIIEEIVEDNVVSSSGKDSKLFMLEWFRMSKEEVVSRIVEPRNGEDVGNLDCDNEVPMTNPFSFRDLMEDSDIDVYDVSNEHENIDGVHEQTACNIHDKLQTRGDIHQKVQETLIDGDLFQQDSVVDWQQEPFHVVDEQQGIAEMFTELNHHEVVEREEIMVEEEEEKEGFVEDDEDSDLDMDANKLPHLEPEVVMLHFHSKVDANLDQSRMFADRLWQEFGHDVIDMDELNNVDKGDDEHAPQPRKRILREIRREYAGKANIKEGDFYMTQNFAHKKLITDELRILAV